MHDGPLLEQGNLISRPWSDRELGHVDAAQVAQREVKFFAQGVPMRYLQMLLLCLLVATGMCRCLPTEHGLRVVCISCCSRGSLTLRTTTTLPIGVAPAAGQLEASVSGLQPLVLLLEQN